MVQTRGFKRIAGGAGIGALVGYFAIKYTEKKRGEARRS